MSGPILIVNPNSREAVTEDIRTAVVAMTTRPVECVTMPENPAFIVTDAQIADVGRTVVDLVKGRPDASAIVIACYAQPGLDALRASDGRPIVGIQDAAVATAIAMAGQFGVIALAEGAIERHLRHLRKLGVAGHLAREVALPDISGMTPEREFAALQEASDILAERGARSIVLGCAGLGRWRERLSRHVGLPVIDPVVAAVGILLGCSVD